MLSDRCGVGQPRTGGIGASFRFEYETRPPILRGRFQSLRGGFCFPRWAVCVGHAAPTGRQMLWAETTRAFIHDAADAAGISVRRPSLTTSGASPRAARR
jgi:hypothetical protein